MASREEIFAELKRERYLLAEHFGHAGEIGRLYGVSVVKSTLTAGTKWGMKDLYEPEYKQAITLDTDWSGD